MSKQKRTENWIFIQQPDGKVMIACPAYIRELLGLDIVTDDLRGWLRKIDNDLDVLLAPVRQQKVLDLLQNQNGRFRGFNWIWRKLGGTTVRMPHKIGPKDLDVLVKQGRITTKKARNGHVMYGITEAKVVSVGWAGIQEVERENPRICGLAGSQSKNR